MPVVIGKAIRMAAAFARAAVWLASTPAPASALTSLPGTVGL